MGACQTKTITTADNLAKVFDTAVTANSHAVAAANELNKVIVSVIGQEAADACNTIESMAKNTKKNPSSMDECMKTMAVKPWEHYYPEKDFDAVKIITDEIIRVAIFDRERGRRQADENLQTIKDIVAKTEAEIAKLPYKLLDVSINKIWCTIVEFTSLWAFEFPEETRQARIDFIITHAVADAAFVDCLYQYFDRIITIIRSSHQIVFRANPITGLFIKPSEAVRHVLPHIRITMIKYKLQSMLDCIVSVKDKLLEKETITGEEFAVEIGIIRDLL